MTDVAVVFLDVGQGDCTVVVDNENGCAALMDCPGGRSRETVAALRTFGVARLAMAFVSHSDFDHLGGMYETVNSTGVDEVRINLDATVSAEDEDGKIKLQAALRAIAGLEDRGVDLQPCYAESTGQFGEIRWRALWPTHGRLLLAQGKGNPNISSVILKLEVMNVKILIGGDAPAGAFARAKSAGEDLSADVFRLSHHGGRIDQLGGPTISELLDEVGARYHIVSVGTGNPYGHPSAQTLRALGERAARSRVLCTEVNETCAAGVACKYSEVL